MSIFGSSQPAMAPPTPPPPPPPPPAFGISPQGQKPGVKPPQASFLGADTTPTQSFTGGGKTLLGT